MQKSTTITALSLLAAVLCDTALAGPFAPAAGQSGSTAVSKNSASIAGWATGVQDYLPGAGVDAAWTIPTQALGPAEGTSLDIVSLGDKGRITLTFGGTIFNGPGWDFAIFENSFSNNFLELAFVEVSSNGTSFVRFPAFSLTPSAVGAFGSIDPTNIDGLAGKYRQGFGTPFDLDLFANVDIPGFDVDAISHIRLVDIKGDGSELDNWPADFGGPNPIYDPFPTSGSVGFDLDAVGVRYLNATAQPVPLPPAVALLLVPLGTLIRRRRI